MKVIINIFFLFLLYTCGKPQENSQVKNQQNEIAIVPSLVNSFDSHSCSISNLKLTTDSAYPNSPTKLIDHINQLPKPVTLNCFLQSLRRPLYINFTTSTLSIQPATSDAAPRMFINYENILLSMNFTGNGSEYLEFSYLVNNLESRKGEIKFPVTTILKEEDTYDRVNNITRSTCSSCHSSERIDSSVTTTKAYISKALKPEPLKNVMISTVNSHYIKCKTLSDYSERCNRMRSLFENGQLQPYNFPSSMPTYYQSFGF